MVTSLIMAHRSSATGRAAAAAHSAARQLVAAGLAVAGYGKQVNSIIV